MSEKTREELLALLKQCNPRQRSTVIQAIEGLASEDKVAYIKEHLSFLEPDLTTREVTFISSRVCDCGKLISQNNVLQGKCQQAKCVKYVCSDCSKVCSRCGRTVCPEHRTQYLDGSTYCRRCRPFKWARMFFDVREAGSGE